METSTIEFTDRIAVEFGKTDFSDDWVSLVAQASFKNRNQSQEKTRGLINRLVADRHGSPFEHVSITFLVTAPIFVWREHMRHRIASYNEESGRYKKLEPVFYVPNPGRNLLQNGKAMDYNFTAGTDEDWDNVRSTLMEHSTGSYEAYERLLSEGIAKEVARMVLPVNIMSTAFVTMNSRALMNFLSLRVKSDDAQYPTNPQYEINLVADAYEHFFKTYMPITHEAFVKNGRVAP